MSQCQNGSLLLAVPASGASREALGQVLRVKACCGCSTASCMPGLCDPLSLLIVPSPKPPDSYLHRTTSCLAPNAAGIHCHLQPSWLQLRRVGGSCSPRCG